MVIDGARQQMISFKERTTYNQYFENTEKVTFQIKIGEFGEFLYWYEKTKNHYHFKKKYMDVLLDKFDEECKRENMEIDDIWVTVTLRRRDDH